MNMLWRDKNVKRKIFLEVFSQDPHKNYPKKVFKNMNIFSEGSPYVIYFTPRGLTSPPTLTPHPICNLCMWPVCS